MVAGCDIVVFTPPRVFAGVIMLSALMNCSKSISSLALNAFHEILDAEGSQDEMTLPVAVTGKEGSRLKGSPQEVVAGAILHAIVVSYFFFY